MNFEKKHQSRAGKKMKILCVADHIDPLVYSVNAKERFKDVHLILAAGDLSMNYLGFIASTLNRPVCFVFGNHNLKHLELFKRPQHFLRDGIKENFHTVNFFGSTYIGDKHHRHRGLLIAGLGGSIRYNDGRNQFTDFQMFLKILKLVPGLLFNRIVHGRWLDILLTHSPPYQLNDRDDPCHRGFKVFRNFMRVFKPAYLLHGHVHLYDQNTERKIRYYQTQIINVYDHYVLDVDMYARRRFKWKTQRGAAHE